jgi:rubrerythrin
MKRPLSTTLRRIVLLALAPLPLAACTGQVQDGTGGGGGSGACAPHWISGDEANGGEVLFPCGLPPAPSQDGQSSNTLCSEYCMGSTSFNTCWVTSDGGSSDLAFDDTDGGTGPTVVACYQDHTGRRPAGLVEHADAGARSIGEVLARAAYLEAAAVDAFRDLAVQLEAHGAPPSLVKRLRRAARDESRHARDVGALARARGAEPAPVTVAETGLRSVLSLALENAREGCVRETWGAASAVAQAERAEDPEVRALMEGIARDELGHAALSWDLGAWLATRLSAEEQALVEAQRTRAVAELGQELEGALPEPWARALGVPSRPVARAIFASMRAAVWGHALAGVGADSYPPLPHAQASRS